MGGWRSGGGCTVSPHTGGTRCLSGTRTETGQREQKGHPADERPQLGVLQPTLRIPAPPQRGCPGPRSGRGSTSLLCPFPAENPRHPSASRSRGDTVKLGPVPEHGVTSAGTFEWQPSPKQDASPGSGSACPGSGRDLSAPGCPRPPHSIPWHMFPHGTRFPPPHANPVGTSGATGGSRASSSRTHGAGHGKAPAAHPKGCLGRWRPAPCFAPGAGRDTTRRWAWGRQWPLVTPVCTAGGTERAGHPVPAKVCLAPAGPPKIKGSSPARRAGCCPHALPDWKRAAFTQ